MYHMPISSACVCVKFDTETLLIGMHQFLCVAMYHMPISSVCVCVCVFDTETLLIEMHQFPIRSTPVSLASLHFSYYDWNDWPAISE